MITAHQARGHAPIARFRDEHREALAGLLADVFKPLHARGPVRVGVAELDGTKVKTKTSFQANRSYRSMEEETERWPEKAAEQDAEAEGGPEELPVEQRDPRSRTRQLEAAKCRVEGEAEARTDITDPDSRVVRTRQGYIQGAKAWSWSPRIRWPWRRS